MFGCIEEDAVSGVLLLCRQAMVAICGAYDCDLDDPASVSSAILLATEDGTLKKKQRKALSDMLEYGRLCSYRIDVEAPSVQTLDGWFENTMEVISNCYKITVGDTPKE